jgi:hypothetical protein
MTLYTMSRPSRVTSYSPAWHGIAWDGRAGFERACGNSHSYGVWGLWNAAVAYQMRILCPYPPELHALILCIAVILEVYRSV